MQLVRLVFLCTLAVGAGGCARFVDGVRAHAPEAGTASEQRLAPGPWSVERSDPVWVDATRPTMANGDAPGADARSLAASVWLPEGAAGPRPLFVYGHGFTGHRHEMAYLMEHLASHGWIVASVDFPLTNGDAPGGPNFLDLDSQPGDLRFAIDRLLADEPTASRIDAERIAVAGLSYGGLTTTLLAFHRGEADPRVKAAVSIAGPSQMFDLAVFERSGPAFLMLAGTEDGIVAHAKNAAPLVGRTPVSVVSLTGGTHLGFVSFASTFLRFHRNADAMACENMEDLSEGTQDDGDPFERLAAADPTIEVTAWERPCAPDHVFGEALRPQRQQKLTMLVVRAYLEAVLGEGAERDAAQRYLDTTLPAELADVAVASGAPLGR